MLGCLRHSHAEAGIAVDVLNLRSPTGPNAPGASSAADTSGVVALAIVALVVIVDLSTQLRRRWVLLGGHYLTYAGRGGHALIDRELYLPGSRTGDPDRCAGAGIPEDTCFATKPALARQMIARALDAGTPARWAAGDEVYGADPALRRELETRRLGYVLTVACSHHVTTTAAGRQRADAIAAGLPRRAWQRLSAGQGSKGPRCLAPQEGTGIPAPIVLLLLAVVAFIAAIVIGVVGIVRSFARHSRRRRAAGPPPGHGQYVV
jgi:hypothetical protein